MGTSRTEGKMMNMCENGMGDIVQMGEMNQRFPISFAPPSVDERIALDSMDKEICNQKSKIRCLEDELLVVLNEIELVRSKMVMLVQASENLRNELEELRSLNMRGKQALNSFCNDLEKCSTFITTMIQRVSLTIQSC